MKKTGEESNTGFDALPEARYNLRVTGAKLETASTGNTMIVTEFEVLDTKFKNRKLWNNFTLTPKAMVFLYSFLKGAESDLINSEDVEAGDFVAAMPGMRVSVWAEPDVTNTGKPRNKLSKWGKIAPEFTAVAGAEASMQKKDDMFA